MDRKPYQLLPSIQQYLKYLLREVLKTGQCEDHSASFRLFSFNDVTERKKESGIPKAMFFPISLHRSRLYSVSLEASASHIKGEHSQQVWDMIPGIDEDDHVQSLELHKSPEKTAQALTKGLQRLIDYENGLGDKSDFESKVEIGQARSSHAFFNQQPCRKIDQLATQLTPLLGLIIQAGQLVEHMGEFRLISFNLPDALKSSSPYLSQPLAFVVQPPIRSYYIALEASLKQQRGSNLQNLWKTNQHKLTTGNQLSLYPDYENADQKLQTGVQYLQNYINKARVERR